ncbi:MAG: DUF4190 domain-containing protein [Acidimicrobiales bacterium]
MAPKNNPLAVGSLIASLCGLIPFVGFLAAIAGIVMGFIARKQIRESNGMQGGAGLALAGIIIGFVLIGLAILLVIAMIGLGSTLHLHCTTINGTTTCH